MRELWVTIDSIGEMQISVPVSAVVNGPSVTWGHVDGPMLSWAGCISWLTPLERFLIWCRLTTVDAVACKLWPHLAELRSRHAAH